MTVTSGAQDERADEGAGQGSVLRATVLASLVAAVVSGVFVYGLQRLYMRYLGAAIGNGSPALGLVGWVLMTVVFGVIFAGLAGNHAESGNSTTGYGLVYGIVLAVFVGLLAVPAAVEATTQWPFPYTRVSVSTLVGYGLYGLVLGSIFGKRINRRPLRPLFLVGRTRSTVVTSLIAGAVAGALLVVSAPHYLVYFALIAGAGGSVPVGFVVFLAFAVFLGLGFAVYPARRVERRDLPGQSGLKLGAAYGVVLMLLAGVLVVPQFLGAATAFDPPAPNEGRGVPVLGGALLGGGAGVGFVFASTPQPIYFLALSYLGVRPDWQLGIVVWFAIALLLGAAFVPLAARAVESHISTSRGAVVGLVYGIGLTAVVGTVIVPSVVRFRGFPIEVPHTRAPILAYAAFGLVFGAVYALLRKRRLAGGEVPTSPSVGTKSQRAIVFGSLFGGAAGGLLAYHMVSPVTMLFMGSLVGYAGSIGVGWVVWLSLSLVFGLVFAVAVGPRLGDYTRSIDEFAQQEEDVNDTLGNYLEEAPVTTTATLAGFAYGVVLAVAVGAIAIPIAVNTISTHGMPVPVLQPYFLLAFVVYGLIMGIGYGVVREY
ncbi:hypothetical protein BRD14_03885 [Halobacteriales archaeon SW_5_68_122]|nr:MAG: hypothetical protein BRD14_03885 [Halobacteriales archaeon SW_5_68_122]